MPQTIALVDDDRNILTSVSIALEAEGFEVRTYTDGDEALRGLTAKPVDLAVLDIKMPRMDGMELLSRLRQTSGHAGDLPDVEGRRGGRGAGPPHGRGRLYQEAVQPAPADRAHPGAAAARADAPGQGTDPGVIVRGDLLLDPARHACTWKGQPIELTVTEFLLVKALALRPGHVKSRDQLMDAAYGEHIYVDDRTIDSHIKRLRKKFKAIDTDFGQIETLYGVGYRYRDA